MDRSVGDEVLARRADGDDLVVLVVEIGADGRLGLVGRQAPIRPGVADLDLVVADVDVDRVRRLALEHHVVPAGVLELGRPVAAEVAVADEAGDGRLAHHVGAAAAREGGAGERAGAEAARRSPGREGRSCASTAS